MAIYGSTPLAYTMRRNMQQSIAVAFKRGSLTISDELAGYVLNGQAIADSYSPCPQTGESQQRKVAAPEVLTGAIKNSQV